MNAHTRSFALAGAISISAHPGAALAQTPTSPDKPMPAHAPASPAPPTSSPSVARPGPASAAVRGPIVHARTTAPTLVHHTFDGSLERVQPDPAEVALDLLDLDDGARQRALAILDKRSGMLDRLVRRNLDQLTELRTDAQTGHVLRVLQIASNLHRQFTREAGDTPLVDQLAGVLPSHDAQHLRDLVDEYWTALVHDEGGADVGRIEAFVIRRRAALDVFAGEIERALERVTADATGPDTTWNRMLAALDLTPIQEREIRAMGRDFYVGSHLNPSKDDTADFLIRVYHKLDPAQRERFFRLIIAAQ